MDSGGFKKQLDAAGLKCTGMHSGDDSRFRTRLDEILREAEIFRTDYVITPWVSEDRRKDVEGCKRVAEELNDWGRKIRAAGFRFGFHNHDAEFKPPGSTTASTPSFNTPKSLWILSSTSSLPEWEFAGFSRNIPAGSSWSI
jgi:hypothetical protein